MGATKSQLPPESAVNEASAVVSVRHVTDPGRFITTRSLLDGPVHKISKPPASLSLG